MSRGKPRTDTVANLVMTAEKLFADRGLDAVSLRQIAVAAGQRNVAAVQYHFESKQALLRAIIEFRLPTINQRRLELLKLADRSGRTDDPRALIEAIARPIWEADVHGRYARFLVSLRTHPELATATFEHLDASIGAGGRQVQERMDRVLADLPTHHRPMRSALLYDTVLTAMARRRREESAVPACDSEEFFSNLLDAAAGMLVAPSTPSPRDS